MKRLGIGGGCFVAVIIKHILGPVQNRKQDEKDNRTDGTGDKQGAQIIDPFWQQTQISLYFSGV